jgi:PAS domain S-box-containing protein
MQGKLTDSAEERVDEVRHLRGCINDLVSLLALPAMWSDHKPPQIIETLLDTLVGILRLDFIYARLNDEAAAQPIELVRLAQYQPAIEPQEVGRALASWLTSDSFTLPLTVANPLGGGKVNLARFSLGLQEEVGLVMAGSRRADFPTETETLLLRVAANQTAIALKGAQLASQRMQAEQASAHLAAIVESSDDAIISKNLQGIIMSWNKGAEKLFGYTAAEAVSQPVTMLIPSQYIDEEPRILEKIRRGETIDHYETVRQRKDGTLLDISLTVSPIRNQAGNIIGASKIARDITERTQAEEALRASEVQLQTLINDVPLGVYVVDGNFRMRKVNPTALPVFGAIPDLIGRDFDEVIHLMWPKGYADEIVKVFRHTLETGEPYFTPEHIEERLDRGVTEYYEWQVNRIPLSEDGYGVVCYFRDISAQVFARLEREKLLTAERSAREAADAASRAKDEFLATVSHELRAPLNGILGWARLLSGGDLSEETAMRGLKAIEQNAKAQAQLIEDLLDVSRIISGKFRLNNQPIQVAPIIEAAVDSVRPTVEVKGVQLQVILDPDAGPVSGDAGRLQQVIWNLLSNAVKFTPRGGRVQVRLQRINSHIEIEVSDSGQGISPEFLPYVFDRFRQADGSSSRSHGGLGLGLAIVRHIIELHAGSVSADSPGRGQGATFTVRLPLIVMHSIPSSQERVHPKVDGEEALRFKHSLSLEGVKVLVVDDEPESLLLLSTLLTQSGAYVKTATSAEEGFAQVKEWRPDVIVSDIGMPGEDGYSFMKSVKIWARETGIWIPAVALTAFARAEDRMKALASGFQIHVPKPVEPAELIAVLVSLVERL